MREASFHTPCMQWVKLLERSLKSQAEIYSCDVDVGNNCFISDISRYDV